jgi:hypothetical protein
VIGGHVLHEPTELATEHRLLARDCPAADLPSLLHASEASAPLTSARFERKERVAVHIEGPRLLLTGGATKIVHRWSDRHLGEA